MLKYSYECIIQNLEGSALKCHHMKESLLCHSEINTVKILYWFEPGVGGEDLTVSLSSCQGCLRTGTVHILDVLPTVLSGEMIQRPGVHTAVLWLRLFMYNIVVLQ